MRKQVGNVEIENVGDPTWARITYHYNEAKSDSIQLRGREDILDLQYALDSVLRDMGDMR
jgi:hypothetical protein